MSVGQHEHCRVFESWLSIERVMQDLLLFKGMRLNNNWTQLSTRVDAISSLAQLLRTRGLDGLMHTDRVRYWT
jgi:hypothetical protein